MAPHSLRLLLVLSCVASTEVLGNILMRPSCAPGWFYYLSNCYGYFRKLRSWSEAELECQSYGNGAHLASLQSVKEATTVAKYITGYQKNQPVWIGLHDPQKKQQWQWIDGAFYVYRSWSDASRHRDKYCAAMSFKNDFLTWESNECSKHQHFLCKYRP
ncbi:regenerating islet-derived protein 4 [Callorhinus ursinus]|uniref:Regenerating islet-derived protein 4 n=2 Tax=Otariidae TaxID=9702 RepID=A0A3Q7P2W9_CALUR|nr:regenerating islet-derived protein 4 [Callorhinus ursinus]XP_027480191.1 regenerating islet-derived protein 4 [Zalophus californianus]